MTKKIPTQAPTAHLENNANDTQAVAEEPRDSWESRQAQSLLWEKVRRVDADRYCQWCFAS